MEPKPCPPCPQCDEEMDLLPAHDDHPEYWHCIECQVYVPTEEDWDSTVH